MTNETKWHEILIELKSNKEEFYKSYKCLHVNREPSAQTVEKHVKILVEKYNSIRTILHVNYNKFTTEHRREANEIFTYVRDLFLRICGRYNLNICVPESLGSPVDLKVCDNSVIESDSSDSEFDEITEINEPTSNTKIEKLAKMPLSATDFLNLATKILPDFDGRPENLQRFLDAINLVKTQATGNEEILSELIKTKLTGSTRQLIGSGEKEIDKIVMMK